VRQQSGHIVSGQGELEFGFGGHGGCVLARNDR
jgi:hypothetical protein